MNQTELKKELYYDPSDGVFVRLTGANAGYATGTENKAGYVRISVLGKPYYAHRLAFLYMTGRWPSEHVDHRNEIKSDNRWENLREATMSQNKRNSSRSSINTSGIKGVSKNRNTWCAQVRVGDTRYRKYFRSKEEAEECAISMRLLLHGEFVNHG